MIRNRVRLAAWKVVVLATYVVVAVMIDLWRVAGYVRPE